MSQKLLRAAKESDLQAIVELEECFPQLERWSTAAWRAEIASPATRVFVVADPIPVAVASFGDAIDVVELRTIAVAPGHRGRGLARQLIERGIEWAKKTSASQVFLEVAHDNASANRLYEKMGFVPVSTRQSYYGPGRDALVMAKSIR